MEMTTSDVGDARIVLIADTRIDAAVAIQFKDKMREAADGGPARVILDMSNVAFIDSSGLGAVVAAMKLLGADHQLELSNLTPMVDKVFRLTRMDSVFTIHAQASDAAQAQAS